MRKKNFRTDERLLCKVFTVSKDGDWDIQIKKPKWKYSRMSHDCAAYRLKMFLLKETNTRDLPVTWRKEINKDIYMVFARVKVNTKRYEAMIKYGFTEIG